ncbi:MAG: bifunctional YncE family protein/alkaline phosphatase family protein [Pedobacter sp.]|jgi:YVTN family beta-propeller protein
MKTSYAFLLLLFLTETVFAQLPNTVISAPAGEEYVIINKNGKTVIPNGRYVSPIGKTHQVAPHPYGLALSSDGTIAITANSGTNPISINILKNILSENTEVRQVPESPKGDTGILESVFMGLAISPDNKTVYVAGGQSNKIYQFDIASGKSLGSINCSFKNSQVDYSHGYIGDMTITKDGRYLYAVDQIGFRMITIDLEQNKLISSCPVGRYPFGITLSKDENTVYVANVGMFQYNYIKKKVNGEWKRASIDIPGFAYDTPEAEKGIQTDSVQIPGLGPIQSEKAFSVWAVQVKDPLKPAVIAKIKTGNMIGELVDGVPAVGGSSPNSLVTAGDYVFIRNGNNDNITVLNSRKQRIVTHIKLAPEENLSKLRGVIPFGLAVSPDEKRVYVAESGINAVAVIDVPALKVIGHIPAGWFPAKLKVSPDGKKLIIANAKGFGSGPNGGENFIKGPAGSYIGSLMNGSVQVTDIPDDEALKSMTGSVIRNNFAIKQASDPSFDWRKYNPIPLFPGQKESPIKHIVFISKENRTYDEVFGSLKNGKGDLSIARYGEGVSFSNSKGTATVESASVMPNHLKLAGNFSFSDNFYVDADVSADGHRWLVNTYPNQWVEATTPAGYGSNRSYRNDSNAPGNLGINGSAGAIYPEDYNEAGSMWDHLARNKVSYFNFGFGVMFEPGDYKDHYKYGGIKHIANYPMPKPLYSRTSYTYPTYNMAIPDQFRVSVFEKEFNEKWGQGKETMPSVLTVILPMDHGAAERPEAGYPFRESYMADNDLAVGRIVEFLSGTPYWKNMLIAITEDDAQNGVDHIDAHRSILMVISPYTRKNYASHTHTSFGSIFKTFWNILGIPYLNQYDAGASDLADMFTDKPDFTPYRAVPADSRIFDPQKALDPYDEKFDWKALKEGPDMDDMKDMIRESRNRDKQNSPKMK